MISLALIVLLVGLGGGILIYLLGGLFEPEDKTSPLLMEEMTILCLGIDKQVTMDERHPETNSIGQADGIFLISVNPKLQEVNIVIIPRDTMAMVEKYNANLEYIGSEKTQICLQYAYADGMQRSSELMVKRVEELFPKTTIDGYISLNIDAVMQMNDAIGGVDVSVMDEYVASTMGVPLGETLHLEGEDAMLYLRLRDISATGSAYTRLDRIKDYIGKAIPKGLEALKKNPTLVVDMFEVLGLNMVTDMNATDVAELLFAMKDMSAENVHTYIIQGEIQVGDDGYEEFYPQDTHMDMLREKMKDQK